MSQIAYYNGEIITVNPNNDVVDGILIENGLILAVGSKKEIFALADETAKRIDLN